MTFNTDKERLDSNSPPRPEDIDAITEPEVVPVRSKIINYIVAGALAVVAVALGIFFYWASAGEKIITVNNEPFPVRTIREHPTAGGVVFIKVDLCKATDIEGELRTSFISTAREVFLPVSSERLEKGCFVREIPVLIPNDLPAGTYKVKFSIKYNLNPLKQGVVDEFESRGFRVGPVTQ